MPKTLLDIDLKNPRVPQIHNRWHPDIPAIASVDIGDTWRCESVDWTGGQIHNDESANDVRDVQLTQVHYLTGPVHVNGVKPGDLLVVDIADIGMLPDSEWGFTGIFDFANGGGFLCDHYRDAGKVCWDFEGVYAKTRHIDNVKFAGLTHPGLIGCAPSMKLLEEWNRREAKLIATNPDRVPPLAAPPTTENAWMGQMKGSDSENAAKIAARTVPGREHGGNCDIKNLSRGSKVYFPVYVDGAKLSFGDIHFSQGDGEISFCGAIETAGWIDFHVEVIRGGMEKYGVKNPIFKPGPVEPRYSEYLVFEGISVDEQGDQHYMDATVAYRQACLNCIEYLKKFGYSGEQAYMLLSTAPVIGMVSGIVDIPNSVCTLALPTEIFDFDIRPNANGPTRANRGSATVCS